MFPIGNKTVLTNEERDELISWKSVDLLRTFTTRFGNIKPRKYGKNSVQQQKQIRKAIIRARELGLLPYTK